MSMPRVEIAAAVGSEHGIIFAEDFIRSAVSTGAASDAVAQTKILIWPDDDGSVTHGDTDAQERYHRIADEIADLTLALLKRTIAETFVAVATVVLAREREL